MDKAYQKPLDRNEPWRLIIDQANRGSWNMAVDEALLESASDIEYPTTLRLYDWQPACLSLGHAQPASEADHVQLSAHGWTMVRRPTGGRAILHTDELTYSLTGRTERAVFAGDILASYRRISAALLHFLRGLGLNPESQELGKSTESNPAAICFETPSNYEITLAGKKMIGSAQARRVPGVLQHGSIPLMGDMTRITQVLRYPDEESERAAAARLQERACSLESATGVRIPWSAAAKRLAESFAEALDVYLVPGQLTPAEVDHAAKIEAAKYATQAWNFRI